jgi:hypothetical protein
MRSHKAYQLLTLAIVAAIGIQRTVAMHRPASMVKYHERVRTVAEQVPKRIGPWIGEDVRVPVQAMTVLRPNVMLSRRYVNIENGQGAGVLLVHCSDAHAMAGHFPLRCYPARGWDVQDAKPRDWEVDGLKITGMEYTFTLPAEEAIASHEPQTMIVANCLLRPGQVLRDMDAMVKSVIGAGGQASGAGQVQVYFDARVPAEDRDAAIVTLLSSYKPVIETILSGTSP